jgi:hypothetical protein
MDSSSEIENHDESDGKPFHDKLHKDMMQALSLSHAETLTDFHQHWVQKGAHEDGQRRLGGGCLSKILQSFKAQGYLTKPQINSVFTVVTQ